METWIGDLVFPHREALLVRYWPMMFGRAPVDGLLQVLGQGTTGDIENQIHVGFRRPSDAIVPGEPRVRVTVPLDGLDHRHRLGLRSSHEREHLIPAIRNASARDLRCCVEAITQPA